MTAEFNHFADLAEQFDKAIGDVVSATAFKVQAGAQQRAKVRSGFMRSSVYTVTSTGSTYGQTEGEGTLVPEVEAPPDDKTAYIGVGANYGYFVEMGSRHGPAQPFVVPSVEDQRGPFEQAFAAIDGMLS